jgi:recombination protein RecR
MSSAIPRPVDRLIQAFKRLPGIGPKTASRLTFFLLRVHEQESLELAQAIEQLRVGTTFCSTCFNITTTENNPCLICVDPRRDRAALCVVEEPLDVMAIERTGSFKGRYHVLHGSISPVEGVGPDDLKIAELVARVGQEDFQELILATNPTMEGEATAMYITQRLKGSATRITRLARGLPSGGDLEYADVRTLSQALEGRQEA